MQEHISVDILANIEDTDMTNWPFTKAIGLHTTIQTDYYVSYIFTL
jgi:hypothetical protein